MQRHNLFVNYVYTVFVCIKGFTLQLIQIIYILDSIIVVVDSST